MKPVKSFRGQLLFLGSGFGCDMNREKGLCRGGGGGCKHYTCKNFILAKYNVRKKTNFLHNIKTPSLDISSFV